MGNINRIDLSKLKSHKSTFDSLEKSFNNSAYSTFNSSYIKRCSDPYVTKMKSNLTLLYNQIKKGYSNIDSWWTKYNQNAEGLEKKLSNEGNTITEYGIRAYATHLPELNDFKIPTTVSYASGGIASALSGGLFSNLGTVVANADPFAAIYSDYNIQNNIKEMVSDTNTKQDKEEAARMVGQGIAVSLTQALSPSLSSFLTTEQPKSILDHALDFLGDRAEDVGNFINDVGAQVGGAVTGIMDGVGSAVELIGEGILRDINIKLEALKRTMATITTFGTSAIKGIGRVFEGVVDFAVSVESIIYTPVFEIADFISGGKYNFTEMFHEQTQAFIANDMTESIASIIGNTGIGKAAGNWMKENAVFYDQVSALGEGAGEVVGILGISALTMGTVNPAIVAGAVGYGKGVQTAYQNGASYGEGVLSGVVTGGLDATTYYLGGKVGGAFGKAAFAPIAGTGAKVTLGNAGIRVGIDMLLGIGDSLLRPFTQFYQDGYTDPDGNYHSFEGMDVFEKYQVMFEQTGGLEGLAVNATLGAGFSTLGEAFDLKRFFGRNTANSSANASNIKVIQTDIRAKMDRYNELLNIKNSDDYLAYMENARKGSVQVLRPEYEGIEQEFVKLKDELLNITSEGVSQAFEPNIGVEKADSASSKSEGLDLKKFFAKESPQKSIIKEVREIANNPQENFGTQFLRTLLSGEEIPSFKKLSGVQLDKFITKEKIPFKQLDPQVVKSITMILDSQGVHNWLGSGYFADALSKLDARDFADMTDKIDVKSAIQNLWSKGTPKSIEKSSVFNVLNRFETTSDLSNYLYPNAVKKWKDAIETIPEFANRADQIGKTQQQVFNRLDYYFKDVCDFKEGNYDYIGDRYVLRDPELNIYDQYVKPEFGSERSGNYYDVQLSSVLFSKEHPDFLDSILSETGQTSLKKNPIKSALYLDANSFNDSVSVGDTYKCTYRINGKIKKLVGEIDYDGMIDFTDRYSGWMKDAQLVDYVKINPEIIEISDSFVDRLLEVRYVRDGKECLDYFMPTEYFGQSGNNSFDFTKIKEKLNLFDDSVDQNSIKLYVSGKSKIDFEHLGIDKNNPLFVSEDIAPGRYGGDQGRVSQMCEDYAITRNNLEDMQKIATQVVQKYNLTNQMDNKDLFQLSSKFASGGCPYTSISNAFLDWCLKNDIQIQDRFGYDIGYYTSDSSLYKISTDFVALDLYLSYQGFSNMKEAIKIDHDMIGLNANEICGPKLVDFFEKRGIHYEGSHELIDLNKPMTSEYLYNKILSEFVQARKKGEYLTICSSGFDLKEIGATQQSSYNVDGALKNTATNGNIVENVGGHAMLITDITKDGKVIVSSWGGKYEFLLDSITSGKNKNSGKSNFVELVKYKFSE